jgi:hypothetical protein
LGAQRGDEAGKYRLAVHNDRAGPALALVAADLGPGQPQAIAEDIDQELVGSDLDSDFAVVDGHG